MKLLIVCDSYLPKKNSAAIQIHDLCVEFKRQGHEVILLTTLETGQLNASNISGIDIHRVKYRSQDTDSFFRKLINQIILPFKMFSKAKTALNFNAIDGIIWYSPSSFLWPLILLLRFNSKIKSYLILRDIFPEWAFETRTIESKIIFLILRYYARFQYKLADSIGIQASNNISYIPRRYHHKVHVLENWLADPKLRIPNSYFDETEYTKKKIFLYAGNVGVAQGFNRVIDLAEQLSLREDILFACFSRGSELERVRKEVCLRDLQNIRFFDVVEHEMLASICKSCTLGIVALDPRHLTHNIPGKFLFYMRSELPVIAIVNENNDLVKVIEQNKVGIVLRSKENSEWSKIVLEYMDDVVDNQTIGKNCRELFQGRYTATSAVHKIASELSC